MYYRDRQDFDNLKIQFNRERVMDEINRTHLHKSEVAENLNKFIAECWEQIEKIGNTQITQYVYCRRRNNYHTNRVEYEAGVRNQPRVENGERYEWPEPGTFKMFSGREKKAAREYAEELATKYNCEIRE